MKVQQLHEAPLSKHFPAKLEAETLEGTTMRPLWPELYIRFTAILLGEFRSELRKEWDRKTKDYVKLAKGHLKEESMWLMEFRQQSINTVRDQLDEELRPKVKDPAVVST